MNRTIIAQVVAASFNLTIGDERLCDVLKRVAKPSGYVFGLFPEQDMRVCTSAYYSLVNRLIALQIVQDKPLQDQPQAGSLEANDNGQPDERSLEREEEIKEVIRDLSALERHLVSLSEFCRKMNEEAGQRTQDGGRVRFNRKNGSDWIMPVPEFEVVIDDQIARSIPGSSWYLKAHKAKETVVLRSMSETEASQVVSDLLTDPSSLDRVSQRAWDNLVDLMSDCGMELMRHEKVMKDLNDELEAVQAAYSVREQRRVHTEGVKARMAHETTLHRENLNFPKWMLEKRLEATALLAHAGTPKWILESPEWLTQEAKEAAAKAQADLSMAQAQMAQMNANMLLMEVNMQLMQQQKAMAEMQAQMNKRMQEFKAMTEPVKPAKEKKAKKETLEAKAPVAKLAPVAKGATIINSRGSMLSPMYRRGM